jgi:hypothetical protein
VPLGRLVAPEDGFRRKSAPNLHLGGSKGGLC